MKQISKQELYENEKDRADFLERLLSVLYGKGWENLTIYDAEKWHEQHFQGEAMEEKGQLDAFEIAEAIKDDIGNIIREVLGGWEPKYRTPDGQAIRWGAVQDDMNKVVDRHLTGEIK